MENQISIIINGVRYDAVQFEASKYCSSCIVCELPNGSCCGICDYLAMDEGFTFKKSDKKFEV